MVLERLKDPEGRKKFIEAVQNDPSLAECRQWAEEASSQPVGEMAHVKFFFQNELLYRS